MSFGDQLKKRREELGLSRSELADRLRVSRSAVGNYETGVSAPKEEVLLRLFDALHVEPNYLYRDAYRGGGEGVSDEERSLLEKYRRLGLSGLLYERRQNLPTVGPLRAPDPPHRGGCAGDHAAGAAGRRPGACAPCHPAVLLPGCSGLCRPGIRGGL